jgi:lambda repressor-like predicted transcriptional regulator
MVDSITKLIKTEIKRQYKSVRKFSEESGIPYSTLSNALSKGIGGTSYDTVIKI